MRLFSPYFKSTTFSWSSSDDVRSLPAITVIDFTDPTLARLNPLDWIRRILLSYHLDWWTIIKTFFSREDFKTVPDAYAVFRNAWYDLAIFV